MAERRTLDGCVPQTMVLDVDVGLGDGGSELRVLVVAIIVSAERRPRRRHPPLRLTSVRPSLSSAASDGRVHSESGRTGPSIHACPLRTIDLSHAETQTNNHPAHKVS